MAMATRQFVILGALAMTLIATFLGALMIGSTSIPAGEVMRVLLSSGSRGADTIVIETIRLPRALTAVLAGSALGIAGLQMQTMFRNPLADPFALGVSAGATLGVALVMLTTGYGATAAFGAALGLRGDALIILAAFTGSIVVLALILLASSRATSPATVLVLGLMCGYAVSAVVTLLVGASQPERLQQWAQWGFGSFSGVPWSRLALFSVVIGIGLSGACATTKQLNALLLGERYARSMGVSVARARLLTILGASLLGAVVTAFCGPVAFLGIAVPHLCRGLLGTSDHRVLVPAVILLGAVVALGAQIVSLLPGSTGVLPLNAVLSIIGAPVVMFILLRSRRGAFVG